MKSFLLSAAVALVSTSAWAQSEGLKVDIDALKDSIFGVDDLPPLVGMMGLPPGTLDEFEFQEPDLALAEDGLSARLGYTIPGYGGTLFDGKENAEIAVVFTPITESIYAFQLEGVPSKITSTNPELVDQGIEINDLSLAGSWNVTLGLPQTMNFDLGSMSVNIKDILTDVEIEVGAASFFSGLMAEYQGEVEIDFKSLEPSTALGWAAKMGPIKIQNKEMDADVSMGFAGMEGFGVSSFAQGDLRPVPGGQGGSPELVAWSQRMNALNFEIQSDPLNFEEAMIEMIALFGELGPLMEPYFGLGSHSIFTVGAMDFKNDNRWEPVTLTLDGLEFTSSATPSTPSDTRFSMRLLPLRGSSATYADLSLDAMEIDLSTNAVDLPAIASRLDALFKPDGTWGDLSGLIVESFDGMTATIGLRGFKFSQFDTPDAADEVEPIELESFDFTLGFTGLNSADGTHIFASSGISGFELPLSLTQDAGLFGDLLSEGGKNSMTDLIPTGLESAVTVSGVPVMVWQEQLEAVPRTNGLTDLDAFAEESEILAALALQFLTPLIESPPTLTSELGIDSPMSRLDLVAEFAVNPLAPPTFGTGEGVLALSNGDKLLQRVLSVEKRANTLIQQSPEVYDFDDFDFAEFLTGLSRALRTLRGIAEKVDGDYRFVIKTDPVDIATINGIPAEVLAERLEQ